jgi:hypothetical protein
LWELLTLSRLFRGDNDGLVTRRILDMEIPRPSTLVALPPALDDVVMGALTRPREARYQDARTMARALEAACPPAGPRDVTEWLEALAGPSLREREALLNELELAADAGLPSVRTQLEVIADRAARTTGATPPQAGITTAPDDATAAVGGRPPERASGPTPTWNDPTRSLEVPPAIAEPAPPVPSRSPILAFVIAALVIGSGAASLAILYNMKLLGRPRAATDPTPIVSTQTPTVELPPPVIDPAPPPTNKPAGTPSSTVPAVKPSASGRKPVRSGGSPDPDGLRLDQRK